MSEGAVARGSSPCRKNGWARDLGVLSLGPGENRPPDSTFARSDPAPAEPGGKTSPISGERGVGDKRAEDNEGLRIANPNVSKVPPTNFPERAARFRSLGKILTVSSSAETGVRTSRSPGTSGQPGDGELAGTRPLSPLPGAHRLAWPAIVLVLLSLSLAEFLTGSTPMMALIHPGALLPLLGLYGAGVLLIRDVSLRWKNGWVSLFLLGFSYAIAEEGIATKTLVDPSRPNIAFLGHLVRMGGINWGVVAAILPFHALYSIGLPILLVDLLFPATHGRPWLGNAALGGTLLILGGTVTLGYFTFDPGYFEGYTVLGALVIILVAFVILAWTLPGHILFPTEERPRRSSRWFFGLGAAYSGSWAFFYLIFPRLTPWPAFMIIAEVVGALWALALVRKHVGRTENLPEKISLVSGLLIWYVPWLALLVGGANDALALVPALMVFLLLWHLRSRANSRGNNPS